MSKCLSATAATLCAAAASPAVAATEPSAHDGRSVTDAQGRVAVHVTLGRDLPDRQRPSETVLAEIVGTIEAGERQAAAV